MPILYYLLLFATIILSGILVFAYGKISSKALKLLLSFSGAYLFALTVLHLIPEVYASASASIGAYVLLGFFIQIVLEIFSEGIEHGHIHIHKHQNAAFPFAMMIGLCIHSFLEGMPLVQHFSNPSIQQSLLAGIIMHHIPVALALMSMLLDSGISNKSAFFYLVVFAIMAPFGAATSSFLGMEMTQDLSVFFNKIMAVVIGIFLHISTTILFESSEEHRFNYWKLVIIVLGAGLALAS